MIKKNPLKTPKIYCPTRKKNRHNSKRRKKKDPPTLSQILNTDTQIHIPLSFLLFPQPKPRRTPPVAKALLADIFIRGYDIRAIDSESEHANVSLSRRDGATRLPRSSPKFPPLRSRPVTSSTPINPDYSPCLRLSPISGKCRLIGRVRVPGKLARWEFQPGENSSVLDTGLVAINQKPIKRAIVRGMMGSRRN